MAELKIENEESESDTNLESDKIDKEHISLLSKVLHLLSVMTIEPMLFFQFLGLCLKEVTESQMILYKTCRGTILLKTLTLGWVNLKFVLEEKFNLSANYCSHIEEHTNDAIYSEIEKEVVFLVINQKLPFAVRSSISALLFLYLKTWFLFCFHFISEVGVISLEEFPSLLFS